MRHLLPLFVFASATALAGPVEDSAAELRASAPELTVALEQVQLAPMRTGALRVVGLPDDPRMAALLFQRAQDTELDLAERQAYARAAAALVDEPALLGAFLDGAPLDLRRSALAGLRNHDAAFVGSVLAERLSDPDPTTREICASILGRRADAAEHVSAFVVATADPSPAVRRLALRTLGWHGGAAQVQAVSARLTDADAPVRLAALRALQRLDAAHISDHAQRMTDDSDASVRRAARELATP